MPKVVLGPETKGGPLLLDPETWRMLSLLAGLHCDCPTDYLQKLVAAAFESCCEQLGEEIIER